MYANFIRYEVKTKVGTYGDSKTVVEMSEEPGEVIDISQVHTIILYVYEEQPVESENVVSEDTDWVNGLV